ncbi:aminotransferase class I/II-fold pyridoxal phosphate-dependent enzyme [Silvanigrella paludirubra]|uniref:Aminotransferase class I/II-fold pyridoxal phosphate-dependent enzyme n=1 Tax=Silvanigrella paludirubra TaxID=2499159 RepID=A0A6N6VTQ7_9BACT|nr:DegT/DnrJ/EryC1/StrS aminotransferase family protein [Silvanigrella paludirubra]KAB8036829.1 aminotransferase class I/II-fold pyridoxal phosphate-dependent enzyme [Silvanigrella paludirubra]
MNQSQNQILNQIPSIPFIDLKTQQELIRSNVDLAIQKVLDHGQYIMGPEVHELEKQLSSFCGAKHVISCANGTDALGIALMAKNVGPGDAIFVPSFTFAATAEVVAWTGATPIFIDSHPDTYNMDPRSLEIGIHTAKKLGLRPSAIIPVDLFGQPADYDAIQAIANEYHLWILADGAQSFGAKYKDKYVGNIGEIATTSFFPAKPLGCYGDGGAIFTNDDEIAAIIKSLRVHGQGTDKYDNVRIGMNGRLDTIQAAILIEKLKIFNKEIEHRQFIADLYNKELKNIVQIPHVLENVSSVWAQYTIRLPKKCNRSKLMTDLKAFGIPSMIYYVKPLHLQKAYQTYPVAGQQSLEICDVLSEDVLSLPMSGYIDEKSALYVTEYLKMLLNSN